MADIRKAIRSVTPIIEQDGAFSFQHKSIQEMFVAKAVGDSLVIPLAKSGLPAAKMQEHLKTLMELGSEKGPVFTRECTVESLTKLLRSGMMKSDPNNLSVSQTRHLAQAILRFVEEVSQSAIATLDLTEEEAVRDFMVDRIMLEGDVLQALSAAGETPVKAVKPWASLS